MIARDCDNERLEILHDFDRIHRHDQSVVLLRNDRGEELSTDDLLDVLAGGGKLNLTCRQGRLLRLIERLETTERLLRVDMASGFADSRFIRLLDEIHELLETDEPGSEVPHQDVEIIQMMIYQIIRLAASGMQPSHILGDQLLKVALYLLKRPFEKRIATTWPIETQLFEKLSRLSAAGRMRAVWQEENSADLCFSIYAIPDNDALLLEKLKEILQQWTIGRLTCGELVDGLHTHARQFRSADTEWWNRFHAGLSEICEVSRTADCSALSRHVLGNAQPKDAEQIGAAVNELIEACNQVTTDCWAT